MLASRRAKVSLCHSDIAQGPGSADPLEQALSEPQDLVNYFNFDDLKVNRLSEFLVDSKRQKTSDFFDYNGPWHSKSWHFDYVSNANQSGQLGRKCLAPSPFRYYSQGCVPRSLNLPAKRIPPPKGDVPTT